MDNSSEFYTQAGPTLSLIAAFSAKQKTYFPTKELHWRARRSASD